MSRRKLKAVDLFSGAGGLTEGLCQAGFKVVGAVELDPLAGRTYRMNHPKVSLWEKDIREITGTEILERLKLRKGELDLLAACPPCQGYSTIRTRNGRRSKRDRRNELILEVLRLVRSLRPRAVMLENVPGLASDVRFRTFRKGLEALGYEVRWQILNTVNFGVPQRRRRLVLLATHGAEPKFCEADSEPRTVRDAIGALSPPAKSRDALHRDALKRTGRIDRLIRDIPKDGGSRRALGTKRQLACHRRTEGFNDVYGRMSWEQPAPTITGGCINPSKGRFLHPSQNRAITLREAAMLQTFPARYRFDLTRGRYAVALMIGNALPPAFIKRHAIALRQFLYSR